jgi:hypothetical protein
LIRKGKWDKTTSGGIFNNNKFWKTRLHNPQYFLNVLQEGEFNVSLQQLDPRYSTDKKDDNSCIGFHIFKYTGTDDNDDRILTYNKNDLVFHSPFWKFDRELSYSTELSVGKYVIIPSQFEPSFFFKFF